MKIITNSPLFRRGTTDQVKHVYTIDDGEILIDIELDAITIVSKSTSENYPTKSTLLSGKKDILKDVLYTRIVGSWVEFHSATKEDILSSNIVDKYITEDVLISALEEYYS